MVPVEQVPSAHASSRTPPVRLSLLTHRRAAEYLRTGAALLEPQGKVQISKSKQQELELLTHVHKPSESPSGSLVQDQDQGPPAVRADLLVLDILNRRNEFLQFVQVPFRSRPGPPEF